MIPLLFSACAWLLLHIGVSGTIARDRVVARIGEAGFMLVFSIASVVTIILMISAYKAAPEVPLWVPPSWLGWLLVLAMLPACVLLLGSVVSPNPTMAGPPRAGMPSGITLITRHPMLWAFTIWSTVHIIGNGDVASIIFFGTFLITARAGMPSIDAKLARRDPARWAAIAATTSITPGAALLAGRAHLTWREIGWIVPVGGFVLWALLLGAHPHVIGVSPLPAQ